MFNKLKKNLPKETEEKLVYEINIGKFISETCFQKSLSERKFFEYMKMVNQLNNDVEIYYEKEFIHYGDKLVIEDDGERSLTNTKKMFTMDVKSQKHSMKLDLKKVEELNPLDFFPATNYHNIQKVTRFTYTGRYYDIHFKIVSPESKEKITYYMITIECGSNKKGGRIPLSFVCKEILEPIFEMENFSVSNVREEEITSV